MSPKIVITGDKNGFIGYVNDVEVVRSISKQYVQRKCKQYVDELVTEEAPTVANEFDINDRFAFVNQLVTMVAKGQTPSAVITGEGGLGKSYSVTSALKAAGLRDITETPVDEVSPKNTYRIIKGFSTAKGLFRILFENRNSILVFDDCDSILKDPDALNLLKGALDSYDKRTITWNTSRTDDLPRLFTFTGGVIFISNISMSKIDQALRTRSMCVDLSMTPDQKIERMETIASSDSFMPDVDTHVKQDALKLIKDNRYEAKELSLRTLIMVTKIRKAQTRDWLSLAKYMLCNG
jgi:hypothetical protein